MKLLLLYMDWEGLIEKMLVQNSCIKTILLATLISTKMDYPGYGASKDLIPRLPKLLDHGHAKEEE